MKFYLAREGVAFGPYSEFQVLESIRLGIFEPNDLALAEDGKEWLEVAQLLPVPGSSPEQRSSGRPAAVSVDNGLRPDADRPLDSPMPASAGMSARAKSTLTTVRLAATFLCVLCMGAVIEHLTPPTLAESGHSTLKGPGMPSSVPSKPPVPAAVDPHTTLSAPVPTMPPAAMLVATPADFEMPPPAPVEQNEVSQVPAKRIEGRMTIEAADGLNQAPAAIDVRLYPLAQLDPYLQDRGAEANAKFRDLKARLVAAEATKERLRKASDQAFDAYVQAKPGSPDRAVLEQASAEAKKSREQAANAYYGLIQDREACLSGAFYLENLPKTASITQTDGEGRFSFEVPAEGSYAIVAGVQSDGDATAKRYYWFIPVSVGEEPTTDVLLSSQNLSSQGFTESLVQTVD